MLPWCVLVLALIGVYVVLGEIDPCTDYKEIHNIGLRYVNYKIDTDETPSHDSRLTEGWYKVGDINATMPETPPTFLSCGTIFPVWLNGTHPTGSTIVTRKSCLRTLDSKCQVEWEVKIKKCKNDFYAYYLKPTGDMDSGYCFGIGTEGTKTNYVPQNPTLIYELHTDYVDTLPYSKVRFICQFQADKTTQLLYRVYWRSHGASVASFITDAANESDNEVLYLTEARFVGNNFKLGSNIVCSVRAFKIAEGPPGKSSGDSNSLYVGIKILTPNITFVHGEQNPALREIRLQPTIPIGCQVKTECSIQLVTYTPGNCMGIAVGESQCGAHIHSKTYQQPVIVQIEEVFTQQYQVKDETYEIYLHTRNASNSAIWKNYKMPKIDVYVKKAITSQSRGLRCKAENDPHMTTFDGNLTQSHSPLIAISFKIVGENTEAVDLRVCMALLTNEMVYENHKPGVYTLYEHTTFDTEIQLQHQQCNNKAMCVCGVAVKAGRDLYRINTCDGKLEVNFISCGDDTITVKHQGELMHWIYITYGTYVYVRIQPIMWTGNNGTWMLTVTVEASIHDEAGASRGLCGLLNRRCGDDFHDKSGGPTSNENDIRCDDRTTPHSFITAWSVNVESSTQNLLHKDFRINTLIPWPLKQCVCDKKDNEASSDLSSITCNPNAVATCTRGEATPVHMCEDKSRRRRSVINQSPYIPEVKIPSEPWIESRFKRQIEVKNWTEAEATIFCQKQMEKSPVFDLCKKVPNAKPEKSIDICVADIMITGGTDWTDMAIETMQGTCMSEVDKNPTLRETTNNSTLSLADLIEEKTCPDNCSSVGICQDGKCKCNEGFGGASCFIDLTKGPVIAGLLDHGLCDEQQLPCDHAYVFGQIFTDSSNLSCRLQQFTISEDGKRTSTDTHYILAEFGTLVEVICPIHQVRSKRSVSSSHDNFVLGYKISVSNDGNVYEEGTDLFVFDSKCQAVEEINNKTHFSLIDGYCFIDNMCVAHRQISTADNCTVCDTAKSTREWSTNTVNHGCFPAPDPDNPSHIDPSSNEGDNYLWIIGVVAGVIVGAIVAAMVVCKLTTKRGKKVGDSSIFKTPTNQQWSSNKPSTSQE